MKPTPRWPVVLLLAVALVAAPHIARSADDSGDDPVRVFFMGNSYTYVNDLPTTFAQLAASGHHGVHTRMDANGGELLQGHAADARAMAALRGSSWEYVVLQEQSEVPASEPARSQVMYPAARELVRAARDAGATPVFLMTWAHRHGWQEAALDYARMQGRIDAAYFDIARETHAHVAPVGLAWQQVRREHPEIGLWDPDGSHPSRAGTYLAACVLYATLFGESPEGLGFTGHVPGGEARTLQRTAARTVLSVRDLWDTR